MFRSIANTLGNCFKIPELKSRILFTLGLLAVCRLLAVIRIPGLNGDALSNFFATRGGGGGLLGMYNTFAGGAFEHCAIGALGIMPYISATIIIQLLTAVVPRLSKLAREEGGRTKIIQYGRYLTVLLCLGQGAYFASSWLHPEGQFPGIGRLVLIDNHLLYYFVTVTVMTAGTMLLMWLGEQISERGIGNGVSLIITIGILARLPQAVQALIDMFSSHGGAEATHNLMGTGILLVALLLLVVGGVIAITQAQRKIPVQYAQRAVGRKMYAGGTSFMPLRVNYAGVMPIIFAQSILMFPQPLCTFLSTHAPKLLQPPFQWLSFQLGYGSGLYLMIYSAMILFFSYFWVATQFNEIQIADDLKKNGGYIPGVRPGQGTSDYLHHAMSRITLAGAIFLTVIATIPIIISRPNVMDINQNVAQFFGGTSILIAVGVLLDTMRQVESHLMMRHYDGFLKKGRIRGRF
ncbi:MAG TPA: preprotein translocase subunit SecY [Candidatus Limnocylindrales bacterium]|jgi:preprotein translocase subunit SecY|nr:preprotein translocase subunit SecY [Candidatus Limnocylindrales bacterium]